MNKILIVDDEMEICDMVKRALDKTGLYEVLTTNLPEEVVGVCQRECPDLILLDLVMPNMEGTEIIDQLRRLPAEQQPRIIVSSGLGEIVYHSKKEQWKWEPNSDVVKHRQTSEKERSAARMADKLGVDDFIAKPFSADTLRQVIAEVLNREPRHFDENQRGGE